MWLLPRSASSVFAPVSECSTKDSPPVSDTSEETLELWVTSSGTPTRRRASWHGWKSRAWSRRLFGPETLKLSDGGAGMELWTELQRASPASRGPQLESATANTTSAGSGPLSLTAWQKLNRHFSGEKTCGDLFQAEALSSSLLTLPGSGSMRSGVCSPRQPLALPTSASEFSSWPTATAKDAASSSGSCAEWGHGETLTDASRSWGTPTASDAKGPNQHTKGGRSTATDAAQWKTPHGFQAWNGPDGNEFSKSVRAVQEEWQTPSAGNFRTRGGDRADELGLDNQAKLMWATPTQADHKREGTYGNGESNPTLPGQTTLWASPKAEDSESAGMRHARGVADTLTAQSSIWPTPLVGTGPASHGQISGDFRNRMEEILDHEHWPTPNASVTNDGETPESWKARNEILRAKGINGNGMGTPLTIAATTWPTPAARDQKGENSEASCLKTRSDGRGTSHTDQLPNFAVHIFSPPDPLIQSGENSSTPVVSVHGSQLSPTTKAESVLGRRRLNPAFVCWLMGWPWWWTRAEPTSFGAAGMVWWRSAVQQRLYFLFGGR